MWSFKPKRTSVAPRHPKADKVPRFFEAQGVDELLTISIALAQELWVVKEQLAALERGEPQREFTPAELAALDAERQSFIDNIFGGIGPDVRLEGTEER